MEEIKTKKSNNKNNNDIRNKMKKKIRHRYVKTPHNVCANRGVEFFYIRNMLYLRHLIKYVEEFFSGNFKRFLMQILKIQ